MRRHAWLVGLVLTSCSSPGLVDTGRVAIVAADSLAAPTAADLLAAPRIHTIGPFDRISVDVLGLPELSRTVQVDADGNIAVPLAGTINVNGSRPADVSRLVEERLRIGHVRNPQVTVGLVETVSQTMVLDGEVETPGIYPVVGNMTLMRAVARAQGTSDFARTSHVVVFRTVNGQRMAALYDLRAIRLAAYEDPAIFANDVIVVGESQARRLFPQIAQASGLILAPLVTLLNNGN